MRAPAAKKQLFATAPGVRPRYGGDPLLHLLLLQLPCILMLHEQWVDSLLEAEQDEPGTE